MSVKIVHADTAIAKDVVDGVFDIFANTVSAATALFDYIVRTAKGGSV